MKCCPKTAPEIKCELCSIHYYPSESGNGCKSRNMCNRHFERWLKKEPEVKQIHEEWLKSEVKELEDGCADGSRTGVEQ